MEIFDVNTLQVYCHVYGSIMPIMDMVERYTNGVYVQSFYFDHIDDKCKSKFPDWQSFLIQISRQTFGNARELIQIDSGAKPIE